MSLIKVEKGKAQRQNTKGNKLKTEPYNREEINKNINQKANINLKELIQILHST